MRWLPVVTLVCIWGCSGDDSGSNDQPLTGACPHAFVADDGKSVLTNVQLDHVFWGTWWSTPTGSAARNAQDIAWRTLANDPRLFVALRAYMPGGQTIHDSFVGSSLVATTLPTTASLTQATLEGELANAIADGRLASPSNAYPAAVVPIEVVYLPPGVSGPPLMAPTGPVDYAAYHASMKLPSGDQVPYVVILYDSPDGLDVAESHEVYETITDPFKRGWHDRYKDENGQYPEIADVCEGDTTWLDGYAVQRVWSPRQCGCVDPDSP